MTRHVRRTLALALAVLTLTTLLGACGGVRSSPAASPAGTPGAPLPGGTLTVGIAQDLDDSLDPHKMVSAGTREVLFNVFEGLVKPDSSGNLLPAVASAYTLSDSGDAFTFTLRPGVKFHNGAAVTVQDVLYSLRRCMGENGGAPLISAFSEVKSVDAPDDRTVVVTLNAPDPEFLAYLTAAIIPAGYDQQDTRPIGTGPFQFVSRTPLESVVLERFDGYWGTPAHLDRVVFKIISSADTLTMSLNSGALDMAEQLTSAQAEELSSDFNILEGTMNLVQAVYLNNAAPPLDNLKVRQALSYAIDRQQIMDFLADGRGTPVGSSMYPALTKYFDADLVNAYPYDPAKAKQLLADAGYPEGFDLVITVPSNYTPHVDTAQVVVEQLKAVGVRASVELVEWNTWLSRVYQNRDFQATIVGFDAAAPTARAMLERWGSADSGNMINFNDPEYDQTLRQAMAATDDAEQVSLYRRCQEILTERAASLYIQDLSNLVALRGNFAGYVFYPLYAMDLSTVYQVG